MHRNPVLDFEAELGPDFVNQWLTDGEEIAADRHPKRPHVRYKLGAMTLHVVTRSDGSKVEWALKDRKNIAGAGGFETAGKTPREFGVAFAGPYRGKGLHGRVLRILREQHFKRPIESDLDRSAGNQRSWAKLGASFDAGQDRWRLNPRRNPPLGNTGLEFKQHAARQLLLRAIHHEGLNPGVVDELISTAFQFAKQRWQEHHNRILPHREWSALRIESTLRLAQVVASGQLRP